MEWKTLSEQIVELQGKLHAAELQVGELQRKLDAATNDLEGFEEENEKLEKRANERDCAAHVASHELEESNRLVGELQKKLDFAAELGRKSMENFDDDLEERPMRHALGALHRQWELFLGVIEKPVGEGPTDRKCCTEAYARGYAVGKEHMAAGIVTEPVIEKRIPEQQITLQHAKDCHCESCETHRKWYCPTCDTLMSSPESTRCVEGHDRRITR